jgi:hypothetical protein
LWSSARIEHQREERFASSWLMVAEWALRDMHLKTVLTP